MEGALEEEGGGPLQTLSHGPRGLLPPCVLSSQLSACMMTDLQSSTIVCQDAAVHNKRGVHEAVGDVLARGADLRIELVAQATLIGRLPLGVFHWASSGPGLAVRKIGAAARQPKNGRGCRKMGAAAEKWARLPKNRRGARLPKNGRGCRKISAAAEK